MSNDRKDVFATNDAKLVLRERWSRQSMHRHRPMELIVALDGPVQLKKSHQEVVGADCIFVPPMKEHALLDYEGRLARIYFDTGYRRLAFWKDRDISTKIAGQAILRDRVETFYCSERSIVDATSLITDWIGEWVGQGDQVRACDPRVADVLRHLDEQTAISANRKSVARLVGLSPSRFAAIFAADTGMSLRQYLNWRRVKIAAALICAGENITRAAAQAGFADGAHLTRSCRLAYGCPPSDFIGFRVSQSNQTDRTALRPSLDDVEGSNRPHICLAPH